MNKITSVDVISYLLILLFLYTGMGKLMALDVFREQLSRQPFLHPYVGFITFAVPVLELLIAGSLFTRKFKREGLYASFFLMAAFTFYVGYMLSAMSLKELPCSCGGIIKSMSWRQHLVFNTLVTFLALVGIWKERADSYKLKSS